MKQICTLDIETNCLLEDAVDYSEYPYKLRESVKFWVVAITNARTMESAVFKLEDITKENLKVELNKYDIVVTHHGHKFDLLMMKLAGLIEYKVGYIGEQDTLNGKEVRLVDTHVVSRLLDPDRFGGHSLKAYGEELGDNKIDYRQNLVDLGVMDGTEPKGYEFTFYHESMVDYCIQDTILTAKIFSKLFREISEDKDAWTLALQMEHKLADLAIKRETLGFKFDTDKALLLIEDLTDKMKGIKEEVDPILPKKKMTVSSLNHYTPPKKPIRKDGELSSHMVRFFERLGIKNYCHIEKVFEFEGQTYYIEEDMPPLKTEEEAVVEDLDVVKHFLLEQGWEPTEWGLRDITKNSKKEALTADKKEKAVKRYVKETLEGKYKKERLKELGLKEGDMEQKMMSKAFKDNRYLVPTAPKLRVGVTKELCPNLVKLGNRVSFARAVADFYTYRHRRSSIAGGITDDFEYDENDKPDTGFISKVRQQDGRIPTPAIECGTNTFRYKHISVANIPRASSIYGKEMRSLFGAGSDFVQFGFDYSSLEARIQGHYIYNYEGGDKMAETLLAEKPNDIHCFSEDTEILTEHGWSTFDKITLDTKVGQYNPDKDTVEMVNPEGIVWEKYKGDMVSIKSLNTDQLLTPNHRVLTFSEKGNRRDDFAKDFRPWGGRYFKTAGTIQREGEKINSKLLKLIVATQADGHLAKDCSAITFTFVKEEKFKRLRDILKDLGGSFSENFYKRNGRYEKTIRIKATPLSVEIRRWLNEDKSFKSNILNLNLDLRREFLEELAFWDGNIKENGDLVIDQICKESIDMVQSVCAISGFKSIVNRYTKTTSYGITEVHRVYISSNTPPKTQLRNCEVKTSRYEGFVGCVTVPSSYVVVRRNGKVFVSGNSVTAKNLGLERDDAKSINYMVLYGGSWVKVVSMLGYTPTKAKKFLDDWWDSNLPLKQLRDDKVREWISTGKKYIRTIDGRKVRIRSQHSIINALFQSAGAIFAKYVTVKMFEKFENSGYCIDVFEGKPEIASFIEYHDENQLGVNKELLEYKTFETEEEGKKFVDEWGGDQLSSLQKSGKGLYYVALPSIVSKTITETVEEVEEMFGMNVPIGYAYETGRTWADCH